MKNNNNSEKIQYDLLKTLLFSYPNPPTGGDYFIRLAKYNEQKLLLNIHMFIKKGYILPGAIITHKSKLSLDLSRLILTPEGLEYTVRVLLKSHKYNR